MYRSGHVGAALLAYAPFGVLVSLAGHEPLAIVGMLVATSLSTLPDYDHRIPFIEHRGPTHTILFALLVGSALAGATAILVRTSSGLVDAVLVWFAFVVGSVTICSHLLADALTPMGIRPFWPVSNRRYTLRLTRAANPIANYLLLALGIAAVGLGAVAVSALG